MCDYDDSPAAPRLRGRDGCAGFTWLLIGLLITAAGCRGGKDEPEPEAGGDNDGGDKTDALFEAGQAPNCSGESGRICAGLEVHRCEHGKISDEIIETCDPSAACSFGRCTTMACAEKEKSDALRGCLFYSVQVDNIDEDDSARMMLLVTNVSGAPANVSIQSRGVSDNTWAEIKGDVVGSPGGARFSINRPVQEAGRIPGAALRIVSDRPVIAAQLVNEDLGHDSKSSGGTALLPFQALRNRYLALTYAAQTSSSVAESLGSRGGAGMIVIVGTEQGSMVIVTPTAAMEIGDGSTVEAGMEYRAGLNEGDVLQLFSHDPNGDLTGTHIEGTSALAVFSGNVFTSYGKDTTGWNGADLAIEQLPPYETWGEEYVGAWHAPQTGCDSFWGAGAGMWQVMAASDGTLVTLDSAPGTTFLVGGQPYDGQQPLKLDRGMSVRFMAQPQVKLSGSGSTYPDFIARSNHTHRILLAQWLDCEPSLSWGIDTRFSFGEAGLVLPPGFDQEVLVVRPIGKPITVDQTDLRDADFGPAFGTDPAPPLGIGKIQVARLTTLGAGSKEAGPCLVPEDACQHVITGGSFGVSWRGMDVRCSFALTLPPANFCGLGNALCGTE